MDRSWRTCRSLLVLLACVSLAAQTADHGWRETQHFVFFGLERERIREENFLKTDAIVGAQLKYTWRELEPERDRYELSSILADLDYLKRQGKRLFIQLQDVSFSPEIINVPAYLLADPGFGGGADRQYAYEGDDEGNAEHEGWVARRWDPRVRGRFVKLLQVLGRELDGKIEGLNLPETSVGFGESGRLHPEGFNCEIYVESIKAIMSAAREAFPNAHVIQYANFMPGEWLPWTDKGYLKSLYAHADRIGVGVGGPDLLPHRKGQLNHSYPLIAARGEKTIAGVAVQWGNYEDRNPETRARVSVAELHAFGRDRLRLDYLFWGTQEPYYSEEVIPYLRRGAEKSSSRQVVPSSSVPATNTCNL